MLPPSFTCLVKEASLFARHTDINLTRFLTRANIDIEDLEKQRTKEQPTGMIQQRSRRYLRSALSLITLTQRASCRSIDGMEGAIQLRCKL